MIWMIKQIISKSTFKPGKEIEHLEVGDMSLNKIMCWSSVEFITLGKKG